MSLALSESCDILNFGKPREHAKDHIIVIIEYNNMEDLSSLEGPPIQDGRFTPISFPMSPVSPENTYIAYNPLRDVPQGSVSPLSSARSAYARSSISSVQVRFSEFYVLDHD